LAAAGERSSTGAGFFAAQPAISAAASAASNQP
jgi:hypothetical protein